MTLDNFPGSKTRKQDEEKDAKVEGFSQKSPQFF